MKVARHRLPQAPGKSRRSTGCPSLVPAFHFISGLPRSGSTLLAAILRQNPALHANVTSPVGAMLGEMSAGSEGAVFFDEGRRRAVLRGCFENYYHDMGARTVFDTSGRGSAHDTIVDFAPGTDRIDLSAIDADTTAGGPGNEAFSFLGTDAFSGTAGELHQVSVNGNTVVEGDVDGNGVADFQIYLTGLHTLQATDFVL